jgi:hypothetical protein
LTSNLLNFCSLSLELHLTVILCTYKQFELLLCICDLVENYHTLQPGPDLC